MVIKIMFFVVMLAVCYQDCLLANSLGEIARTPFFMLSPLLFVYAFFSFTKTGRIGDCAYIFGKVILYGLTLSVIYILLYTSGLLEASQLDQSYFADTFKICSYFILQLIFIVYLEGFLKGDRDFVALRRFLLFFFVFSVLFVVIEFLQLPQAFTSLHAHSPDVYYRLRFITRESSWAGSLLFNLLIIYCFLLRSVTRSKWSPVLECCILLFLFAFASVALSKGLYICSALPIIYFLVTNRRASYSVVILFLIVVLWMLFSGNLWYMLSRDLEEFTSVATRASMFVASFVAVFYNPMGTSYAGFFTELHAALDLVLNYTEAYDLDFSVVKEYIDDLSSKNLSTKSGFLRLFVLYGIPGLFVLVFFVLRIWRQITCISSTFPGGFYLKYLFFFNLFSLTFYLDFQMKYEYLIFWVFVSVMFNKCIEVCARADSSGAVNSLVPIVESEAKDDAAGAIRR